MMNPIDAAELAALRAELATLLPDTCVISAGSLTPDNMGEVATTWTPAGTVACRIDPIKAGEQVEGGAVQPYSRMRVTLPYNAAVTSASRLTIGGVNYAVISILSGNSWALDKRLEVQPE
jgi:SPP1 family predicted phage head-tail adaptor